MSITISDLVSRRTSMAERSCNGYTTVAPNYESLVAVVDVVQACFQGCPESARIGVDDVKHEPQTMCVLIVSEFLRRFDAVACMHPHLRDASDDCRCLCLRRYRCRCLCPKQVVRMQGKCTS